MKTSTNLALALSMGAVDVKAGTGSLTGSLSREDVQAVSPALQRYATDLACRRATAASPPSPQ